MFKSISRETRSFPPVPQPIQLLTLSSVSTFSNWFHFTQYVFRFLQIQETPTFPAGLPPRTTPPTNQPLSCRPLNLLPLLLVPSHPPSQIFSSLHSPRPLLDHDRHKCPNCVVWPVSCDGYQRCQSTKWRRSLSVLFCNLSLLRGFMKMFLVT